MELFLVATAIITCFSFFTRAVGTNDCTDPRGQLAFKTFQSTDKIHMLYTNFDSSVIVCTYVTKISEDSSTMSLIVNFTYQINDIPVVYNDPTTIKIENCGGLIGMYNNTSGEKVSQSYVLYSNFATCNIHFNVEQQECQLWASEKAKHHDIKECLAVYKTLCDGEIYEVYNSTCLT